MSNPGVSFLKHPDYLLVSELYEIIKSADRLTLLIFAANKQVKNY